MQVRGNLHMVSELINECMDYGIVTQLKQHVVLERLHSKYLAPKQPLLSLARPGAARTSHFRCVPTQTWGTRRLSMTDHPGHCSSRQRCQTG